MPPITDAVAINGPGAAQLTVRRDTGGDYRIVALMVNAPGVVTISGLNITNGLASGSFPDSLGGGIANLASGTANISDCILSGNSAAAGGAVSSVRPDSLGPALTTNITNCVLNNNTAGSGGGIYNDSTLTITHSTLSGNKATTSGDGGGITQLTTGSTVITDSIISGNSALDSSGFGTGGGIHNNSILTIVRSTISGNSAGNNGGAISNNSGAVTITNSTLSGNTAGASGGGIANSNSVVNGNSSVNIMNSTISGNGAIFGGGIDNEHFVDDGQQQVKLTSTIVANSTVGPDVRGVITSQGYNIMGVTSGAIITPATGDQLGVSAAQLNLGPLQDNGGSTPTMAPQCGSVAIDKGIGNSLSTDQRGSGFARTANDPTIADAADGTDVGAFELQPTCGGPTPTDVTPPVITPNVSGPLGNSGWYTSDVQVSWSVVDNESGVTNQTGCALQTISADTSGLILTCTATSAGGTTSQSVTIKRDATAPTLAPTVSPNPVFLHGTATATPNASDALSGIASQSCGAVNTSTVGAQSVLCTATDNAGNSANANANYQVTYNFVGFFQPVDNVPTLNIAPAGSSISVKFSLSGNQGLAIFAAGYPASSPILCDTTDPSAVIEETVNAGGSTLSYNATTDQYSYVWRTDKAWKGTCRMLVIKFNDDSQHLAKFRFK